MDGLSLQTVKHRTVYELTMRHSESQSRLMDDDVQSVFFSPSRSILHLLCNNRFWLQRLAERSVKGTLKYYSAVHLIALGILIMYQCNI